MSKNQQSKTRQFTEQLRKKDAHIQQLEASLAHLNIELAQRHAIEGALREDFALLVAEELVMHRVEPVSDQVEGIPLTRQALLSGHELIIIKGYTPEEASLVATALVNRGNQNFSVLLLGERESATDFEFAVFKLVPKDEDTEETEETEEVEEEVGEDIEAASPDLSNVEELGDNDDTSAAVVAD